MPLMYKYYILRYPCSINLYRTVAVQVNSLAHLSKLPCITISSPGNLQHVILILLSPSICCCCLESLFSGFLPELCELMAKDFLWRRIGHRLVAGLEDRPLEPVLEFLIRNLEP